MYRIRQTLTGSKSCVSRRCHKTRDGILAMLSVQNVRITSFIHYLLICMLLMSFRELYMEELLRWDKKITMVDSTNMYVFYTTVRSIWICKCLFEAGIIIKLPVYSFAKSLTGLLYHWYHKKKNTAAWSVKIRRCILFCRYWLVRYLPF